MENRELTRQRAFIHYLRWIIPVILAALVTLITYFDSWIEDIYVPRIYYYIALIQRNITGWVPFSLGDIFYFLLSVFLLVRVIQTIINLVKRRVTWKKTWFRLARVARLLLWIYIIFSLVWGWNYHRKGIAHQLELQKRRYTASDIREVMEEVIIRMNENRRLISGDTILPARSFSEMKEEAKKSFDKVSLEFPFLRYEAVSIKKSMFSRAAKYMGYTGYYNPFSGEAQLRVHMPEVVKPFILAHEIGHQLGYASESEASFTGYLACSFSEDPYTRYSAYLDLYRSLRSKLFIISLLEGDSSVITTLREYNQQLDTLVRYDRRKIREYFQETETILSAELSAIVMSMYDQYLKANKQVRGIGSYDDVTGWLIAYRRKFGRL